MGQQHFYLMIVLLLGVTAIVGLAVLVPLARQLRRTAQQVESTAASMERVLNREFKDLLRQGEKVLDELEDLPPLVKEKIARIPTGGGAFSLSALASPVTRGLVLLAIRSALRRVRSKQKP